MKYFLEPVLSFSSKFLIWLKGHKAKALLFSIGAVLAVQYLLLPNIRLLALRKTNPIRTALMYQRMDEAKSAGKAFSLDQRWVPLSHISKHLINAVIVAEDGMFYAHEGVDWFEVEESIKKNIQRGKAARGGSTITQQLTKNLFLSTSKDPVRKLKELIVTLRMERVLSKRRILEIYLNVIEWGNGVFGAEAAARKYFGKSASELTREEAAQMAAVIPSPRRYKPNEMSRYVERRTVIILNRMAARGF